MGKKFSGKAIYNPSGKAEEYSYWACNFYIGCTSACDYCYCKSLLRGTWSDKPVLKKSLIDEITAFEIFKKEADKNLSELRNHGLFFNFVSDPFLHETINLNMLAIFYCINNNIPVKVLTKQTWWIPEWVSKMKDSRVFKYMAIGFTLTGFDYLEPGAAKTSERIAALKHFNDLDMMTWASMEPVIGLDISLEMIRRTQGTVDLYKIGLKSGDHQDMHSLEKFIDTVISENPYKKIYFKDSLLLQAGINRNDLPSHNCVTRDYNIFTDTDIER
ncbi:MAG: hypothetical protein PHT07_15065 [Paludibacter sp.]|nr:hypothetical protein [Paludibacter sp.]